MTFGILIHCFVQRPLYFLQCTLPSFTFIKSFISFNSSLHKMFRCLLGPRSFNSPKRPLVHKQASFPITFNGVMFISTFTIAPTTYLGNWTLIVLVMFVRFMVDQLPFLLEALAWININTFPFQQQFKVACDLLPLLAQLSLFLFEQLIGQQMVQLQVSIFEHLHYHTLSIMLSDGTSKVHHA
jgi:hypothetical protein